MSQFTALRFAPIAAAVLLLPACHVRLDGNGSGNDMGDNATVDISAPANGQDGHLTIQASGFNLSMDVPEEVRGDIRADNSDFIYPGSSVGGVHIAAGQRDAKGNDGHVEIGFTTADAVDRVVAWYRDPARGQDVHVGAAAQDGNAMVISGTRHVDEQFSVRIAPHAGGGTEARLTLSGR